MPLCWTNTPAASTPADLILGALGGSGPARDDVADLRPHSLFQLAARRADEDEAGNALRRRAEGIAHRVVIGGPAGHPASRKARGVHRVEQVHAGGAAAQLLLPERDLRAFAGA